MPNAIKSEKWLFELLRLLLETQVFTLSDLCVHDRCGVVCTQVNNRTTRRLRDLSISSRAVYLVVSVRQFRCSTCGSCPTERLPFADANKSYPHRQARCVFAWCRKQAYAEVGAVVGRHAKTVERLVLDQCRHAERLSERYARLRRLGIDV